MNDLNCQCLAGYAGTTCKDNISPNPCENNGTCTDLVDYFVCECAAGFTGENWTVDINECDPNPCVNNASCIDSINNYTCLHMAGYDGRNCQINIDDCQPNPCLNGRILDYYSMLDQ